MQVGFSLHPMSLDFNEPNNLIEGSVVWHEVVEEVEMGGTNTPGTRGTKQGARAHGPRAFKSNVKLV